jgi:hypothetical protein
MFGYGPVLGVLAEKTNWVKVRNGKERIAQLTTVW